MTPITFIQQDHPMGDWDLVEGDEDALVEWIEQNQYRIASAMQLVKRVEELVQPLVEMAFDNGVLVDPLYAKLSMIPVTVEQEGDVFDLDASLFVYEDVLKVEIGYGYWLETRNRWYGDFTVE